MFLLKKTLFYIIERLNELNRLALVSFDKRTFDRSHGLKCINRQRNDKCLRKITLINFISSLMFFEVSLFYKVHHLIFYFY